MSAPTTAIWLRPSSNSFLEPDGGSSTAFGPHPPCYHAPVIRFGGYVLRTVDVAAARAFYGALLRDGCPDVAELPAAALARGARPHWLGWLSTPAPEALVEGFLARGATTLGPTGGPIVALRERSGALVGVAADRGAPARRDVAWHQLWAHDRAAAMDDYAALCGWVPTTTARLPGLGVQQRFAWATGAPEAGAIGQLDEVVGVHPQWLFAFAVDDLDAAIATVRATGGLALDPITLPSGDRVVGCDDPQGAALALMQMSTPGAIAGEPARA